MNPVAEKDFKIFVETQKNFDVLYISTSISTSALKSSPMVNAFLLDDLETIVVDSKRFVAPITSSVSFIKLVLVESLGQIIRSGIAILF